jgi:uncharacterized membrane protein YgcG
MTNRHCHGTCLQVLTTPSYHAAAARISAKLQTYAAFRHPLERAADEMEVLIADTHQLPRTSSSSSSASSSGGSSSSGSSSGGSSDNAQAS